MSFILSDYFHFLLPPALPYIQVFTCQKITTYLGISRGKLLQ